MRCWRVCMPQRLRMPSQHIYKTSMIPGTRKWSRSQIWINLFSVAWYGLPLTGEKSRFPSTLSPGGFINGSGEEVVLERGSVFLIRYSAVRKYIVEGDVELIWRDTRDEVSVATIRTDMNLDDMIRRIFYNRRKLYSTVRRPPQLASAKGYRFWHATYIPCQIAHESEISSKRIET